MKMKMIPNEANGDKDEHEITEDEAEPLKK